MKVIFIRGSAAQQDALLAPLSTKSAVTLMEQFPLPAMAECIREPVLEALLCVFVDLAMPIPVMPVLVLI